MEQSLKKFLSDSNGNGNREMLCNICNRYLTVPPINYNNKLGNICGRCAESSEVCEVKKLKNKNAIMERQKVFESIARYLTFPCSFQINGCDAELGWEIIDLHERDCPFKTTTCFLSNKEFLEGEEVPCDWIGPPVELVSHFSKKHTMYYTSNPRIVLGLEASSIFGPLFGTDTILYQPKFQSKIFYFEVFESVAIGVLYYDKISNIYFCHVFTDLSYHKCKLLEYQLELFDDLKKNSVVFPKADIQSLSNNFYSTAIRDDGLEIDLNYMNKLLRMPHFITGEFKMLKKYEVQSYYGIPTAQRTSLAPHNELFDRMFIDNLKCNLCGKNLSSPIYLCTDGHNICKYCRPDVSSKMEDDECTVCSASWSDGERNFAMEKLTLLINYPCKNRPSGCSHMAPMREITEHEQRCPVYPKIKNCFLEKCSWQGTNLRVHIKDKHSLLNTDRFYRLKNQQCCFIFDEDVFGLTMEICLDNSIKYLLICCGSANLKYRYELEIIEGEVSTKMTSKFIINQLCQPELTSFETETVQVCVPVILLPQLFSNITELKFKINIFPLQDN